MRNLDNQNPRVNPGSINTLPPRAEDLLARLQVSPRLRAHLELVHEAAILIVSRISARIPSFKFDEDAVLFGAATHDIGKIIHPEELDRPGSMHEDAGRFLLEEMGVPAELARFAQTHGIRAMEGSVEDLLVALADAAWKGLRAPSPSIEDALADAIADATGIALWEATCVIGDIMEEAGDTALEKLGRQASS